MSPLERAILIVGPNRVSSFSPSHLRMETDAVSKTSYSFQNTRQWQRIAVIFKFI
jgi:hypothetical protein